MMVPFPVRKMRSVASSYHALGALDELSWPLLCSMPRMDSASLGRRIHISREPSVLKPLPCKKAVLTSLVNGSMPNIVATFIITPLASLVSVGLVVEREPLKASGSLNPWTTRRAFALGEPSGFFFQPRMNLALRIRSSGTFLPLSKCHAELSKNDCNSFSLGFAEGHPILQAHVALVQRLVAGLLGVALFQLLVEELFGLFAPGRQDLEARVAGPGIVRVLWLGMA